MLSSNHFHLNSLVSLTSGKTRWKHNTDILLFRSSELYLQSFVAIVIPPEEAPTSSSMTTARFVFSRWLQKQHEAGKNPNQKKEHKELMRICAFMKNENTCFHHWLFDRFDSVHNAVSTNMILMDPSLCQQRVSESERAALHYCFWTFSCREGDKVRMFWMKSKPNAPTHCFVLTFVLC